MQCPSCGAYHSDAECCTECGTSTLSSAEPDGDYQRLNNLEAVLQVANRQKRPVKNPTLLEFPGVTRNAMPEWRRELSERVREVQERRAREAAQEAAAAERRRLAEEAAAAMKQLALLPQPPSPPQNPLVAAALRRIERANQQPISPSQTVQAPKAGVAAVAFAADDVLQRAAEIQSTTSSPPDTNVTDPIERTHKLAVVPAAANGVATGTKASPPAAKRLIREDDGVLDYLVTVPGTMRLEEIRERQAGMLPRVVAALIDLFVCALFFSPFFAVVELTNRDWLEVRIAGSGVALGTVVIFLYLTFSTALAGRTLGMRVLSLRIVDRKTGLIPTGAQSVGRAAIFLGSIFALGLPVLYALIHEEGQTPHDHLTGTVVVRA